jgi:iron complex transport system substrate-binding protein
LQIRAVKNRRIYVISSEIYTGPRALVGVLCFARWLHPQLFAKLNPEAVHKEFFSRFHGLEAEGAESTRVINNLHLKEEVF